MTRLRLNREFLGRHLFALAAMAGIGAWFAYDGLVAYPRTEAAALYEAIEGQAPAAEMPRERLEAFKRQKISTQCGLALLGLVAGLAIGAHLAAVAAFRLEFDETGFAWRGRRYAYGDIGRIDDRTWKTKGRARVFLRSGGGFTLDAWHFANAERFHALAAAAADGV